MKNKRISLLLAVFAVATLFLPATFAAQGDPWFDLEQYLAIFRHGKGFDLFHMGEIHDMASQGHGAADNTCFAALNRDRRPVFPHLLKYFTDFHFTFRKRNTLCRPHHIGFVFQVIMKGIIHWMN